MAVIVAVALCGGYSNAPPRGHGHDGAKLSRNDHIQDSVVHFCPCRPLKQSGRIRERSDGKLLGSGRNNSEDRSIDSEL